MSAPRKPAPDEVVGYMSALSNWGRWGADDTKGTLNLVGPTHRAGAAALVRDGECVSLGKRIPHLGMAAALGHGGPQSHMLQSGERYAWDDSSAKQFQFAVEALSFIFHGETFTHVDDLSHVFYRGQMYNGRPSTLVTSAEGAQEQNVDTLMRDGVFTRGVLLDFARHRGVSAVASGIGAFPEDLEAMEQAQGVRVGAGDVVLLRTGHQGALDALEPGGPHPEGHSGWAAACLPWFHDRGVAMIGADVVNEVNPTGYDPSVEPGILTSPVHAVSLVAMGLPLLDNAHLERLAAACAAKVRWEFCFTLNPLRIDRGTGSPVNPVAIF